MTPRLPRSDIPRTGRAFSLVEMLVVVSVVGTLLALAAPALLNVSTSRKATIHEVAGTLNYARSEAIARQTPVLVAFANANYPIPESRYRAYALFLTNGNEEEKDLEIQSLSQLSPWHHLPEGIIFTHGNGFEVDPAVEFRTVFDSSNYRLFTTQTGNVPADPVLLPFIAFGSDGEIISPDFFEADSLFVGIAEGFLDTNSTQPKFTNQRAGSTGSQYPQGDCLKIGFYTGNVSILTD